MSSLFPAWDEARYCREADILHHELTRLKNFQVRVVNDIDALTSIVSDNVQVHLHIEALQRYPVINVLMLTEKLTALSDQGRAGSQEYHYYSVLQEVYDTQRLNDRLSYYARQLREHLPGIAPIA